MSACVGHIEGWFIFFPELSILGEGTTALDKVEATNNSLSTTPSLHIGLCSQ